MGRPWQIFVAPGPEEMALPTAPSPWVDERWAQIPREHWRLILSFAERLSFEDARLLEALSYAVDFNKEDLVRAPLEQIERAVDFLDRLRSLILASEPLVPNSTDDIPDAYENEEHVRMVEAVAAVFRESLRLEQPFRAWSE